MTESRPSRGCLGAETIESSRSQGTWAAELPESRVSQRYLGPKRLWGLELLSPAIAQNTVGPEVTEAPSVDCVLGRLK